MRNIGFIFVIYIFLLDNKFLFVSVFKLNNLFIIRFVNMLSRKLSVLVITFVLIFAVNQAAAINNTPTKLSFNTSKLYHVNQPKADNNVNYWYGEDTWADIQPDGWVSTHVGLSGNILTFGGYSLTDLMPPEMMNKLIWGGLNTWDADSPWDNNMNIYFRFATNIPSEAEAYADAIINALSPYLIFDVSFEGSQGRDDWVNGQEMQVTDVWYSGHVDWTNMKGVIDSSVPRNIGGLAETVNVYAKDNLNFHFWNEWNGQSFGVTIGLDKNMYLDAMSGGYSESLKSYFDVDEFKVTTYNNGELNMYIQLPNATNVALSVGNSTNSEVYYDYHPFAEAHNQHHYWDINARFTDSFYASDITLNFDYQITPWEWINRDSIRIYMDPRGYEADDFSAMGLERTGITENLKADSPLLSDVIAMDFEIRPADNYTHLWVSFKDNGLDYESEFLDIIGEINTTGYDILAFNVSNSRDFYDTYYINYNDTEINTHTYEIYSQFYLDPQTYYPRLFGFNTSAVISGVTLDQFMNLDYSYDTVYWGLYSKLRLSEYQLGWTQNPADVTPSGDHSTSSQFKDLFDPYYSSYSGIPWNSNSSVLQLYFDAPYNGIWTDINFAPDTDNGWDWDSGRWNYINWEGIQRFSYSVNIYSPNPQFTDEDGNILGPVNDWNVTWNFNYYSDSDDIEPPQMDDILIRNGTYVDNGFDDDFSWPSIDDYNEVSGDISVALVINDQSPYREYWDPTQNEWMPKFPSSGIAGVNVTLFRTDAPIDNDRFLFYYSNFVFNTTNTNRFNKNAEIWTGNIDTTDLADGEWQLGADMIDNDGNVGKYDGDVLYIDNYQNTTPANIYFDDGTPAENSHISDIVNFNFTVVDDIGSFVTIVWTNLGGFIVDPSNVITNSTGVYEFYNFTLDTIFEAENAPITLKIEVLDMDGFWSSIDRTFIVDNIPTGSPPNIEIYAPVDNMEVNSSVTPSIEFVAEINDDVGIKSAKLIIDGYNPFYLNYNGTHWVINLNIETWAAGSYNWYIEVTDNDENQHIVRSPSRTFTILNNAVVTDTEPPTFISVDPSDGATVSDTVTFTVNATDNYMLQQVVITLPTISDTEDKVMDKQADGLYTYSWDSTSVADNTYTITFKAIDSAGNDATYTINITTANGRTASTPELGLPGFELYIAIFAMASVIFVRRKYMK